MNTITDLLKNTDKRDDCLIWNKGKTSAGYGIIYIDGEGCYTHRLAWQLVNGDIPENMIVCHTCDTPSCINPDHLFLGTYSDNMRDMVEKGRYKKRKEKAHEEDKKEVEYKVITIYIPKGETYLLDIVNAMSIHMDKPKSEIWRIALKEYSELKVGAQCITA